MSKQSGLGDQLYIAGRDLGADINSIGGMSTPRETLPATGITMSAQARMYGKRDAQAEFTSYFEDTAAGVHDTLNDLPRTDVHLMYLRGATAGNASYCSLGKQVNYDPKRGDDGSLLFGTSMLSSSFGADWCKQLTAGKITHASATATGNGIDFSTGTKAFGFQAYLQVFSIGSGTATVKIQESSDLTGAPDAFADVSGGGFTAVTGRTAERIQSVSATLSVERYLRVVTTGTFTNLVFAVSVNRNDALRAI
jgi:hypothetical protein